MVGLSTDYLLAMSNFKEIVEEKYRTLVLNLQFITQNIMTTYGNQELPLDLRCDHL